MKRFGPQSTVCAFCPRHYLWCLCLALSLLTAAAANFTTFLDRSTISLGESATLSLTFEGGTPKRLPALPTPPNLTFESLGQKSQFTVENGASKSSVSYEFQVTAAQPGDYIIPPIQVEMNNQIISSKPLKLKVTKGNAQTGLAFLKLIPAKDTLYVGECLPVEVQLFLTVKGDSLQMPQIQGDGFTFGKIAPPTQSNTQIGNQGYLVVTFRLSAVAVKTGELTLGPAQCSLVLYVPMNTRSRGLLDDFFGGGIQRKPVNLSSEPQKINVLPLPKEGQPPDFNGAVGSFSFAASASPTNLTAGDPITLHVQVTGQGNLESIPFPASAEWHDFKLYPPTSKIETTDPMGISGTKSFERVVIPQNADVREIPSLRFHYFDPDRKAYRTLASAPSAITVRPGDRTGPQPTVLASASNPEQAPPPAKDIVHIKTFLGTVTPMQEPLLLRPWFLAVQCVPVLAWVSALIWRKRQEKLSSNPRLKRRLLLAASIQRGSKELVRCAKGNDADAFYATVFRLLQEQLGERLDLPASAITESVLDEKLAGRAPEGLVSELHELFQICNQARYAPQRSSQELMALVPKVEEALSQLRQLPDLDRAKLR